MAKESFRKLHELVEWTNDYDPDLRDYILLYGRGPFEVIKVYPKPKRFRFTLTFWLVDLRVIGSRTVITGVVDDAVKPVYDWPTTPIG